MGSGYLNSEGKFGGILLEWMCGNLIGLQYQMAVVNGSSCVLHQDLD